MDEIILDDKTYVSSKRAAQITGYAKDYVGQLCREGRVEARLVGRNWYVLEASIREHRFGSEQSTAGVGEVAPIEEIAMPVTWEPTNYSMVEAPELIPTLIAHEVAPHVAGERSEVNILEGRNVSEVAKVPDSVPVDSKVVREMQSAWHDWFSRTNEFAVPEQNVVEEVSEYESEEVAEEIERDETPVNIDKVTDQEEIYEEVVPIHRTFSRPEVAQQPVVDMAPSRVAIPLPTYEPLPKAKEPEGRIIRERRVIRRKRPSKLAKLVLVLIALAAIAVTVIGTGSADSFVSKFTGGYAPLQVLVGQSSFTKDSR